MEFKSKAEDALPAVVTEPIAEPSQESPDVKTQHQAYSHLSRMHSSTATTFLAMLLAYGAYVVALKTIAFPQSTSGVWLLFVAPLPVLALQGLKYYATNMAFRRCGQKVAYGRSNLHEYLYGPVSGLYAQGSRRLGSLWLLVTQGWLGWLLLLAFLVAFVVSLVVLVPQGK